MSSNVKIYRTALGFTQNQMASYLDIARQTYVKKELGHSPFNDYEKVKLKDLFKKIDNDVTIDKIFFSKSYEMFRK